MTRLYADDCGVAGTIGKENFGWYPCRARDKHVGFGGTAARKDGCASKVVGWSIFVTTLTTLLWELAFFELISPPHIDMGWLGVVWLSLFLYHPAPPSQFISLHQNRLYSSLYTTQPLVTQTNQDLTTHQKISSQDTRQPSPTPFTLFSSIIRGCSGLYFIFDSPMLLKHDSAGLLLRQTRRIALTFSVDSCFVHGRHKIPVWILPNKRKKKFCLFVVFSKALPPNHTHTWHSSRCNL